MEANIDLDESWCYTTGERHIRVGVFDSVIDYTPEEFIDNEGITTILGYDYINNNNLVDTIVLSGGDDHGTKVAGIIGALRNNGKGISEIAGGDYQYYEENNFEVEVQEISRGVQLYSCRIGYSTTIQEDLLAEAFLELITDDQENEWGEAIHIMNHSWRRVAS